MLKSTSSSASHPNRRDAILAGAGITAAGLAALASVDSLWAQEPGTRPLGLERLIEPGQTILFQGDSITDAGRNRNDDHPNSQKALGNGYAWLAAAQLLVDLVIPGLDRRVPRRAGDADLLQQGRGADRAGVQAIGEFGHDRVPRPSRRVGEVDPADIAESMEAAVKVQHLARDAPGGS